MIQSWNTLRDRLLQDVLQPTRRARTRWLLLLVGLTTSIVLATFAASRSDRLSQLDRGLSADVAVTRVELDSASALGGTAEQQTAMGDFSQRLPSSPDLQPLLAFVQRSCAEAAVVIASAQMQASPSERDQLPKVALSLTLRGSYPRLKEVLSEVLQRFPAATLVHLAVRRSGAATDPEATVLLALWARPEGSSPSAGALAPDPGRR